MSETRCDIDIDDPNFWEKWAKKADLDVNELAHKVMGDAAYGSAVSCGMLAT